VEELAHSNETPAGKLATERLIAAALDSDLYPNGTAFIHSDAPDLVQIMARNVAEGRPIAIIDPHGHEILATPAQGAFAVLVATLFAWLGSRSKPIVRTPDGAEVMTLPQRYRVQVRQPPAAAA
jgi:hypothetical protein